MVLSVDQILGYIQAFMNMFGLSNFLAVALITLISVSMFIHFFRR